jgi:ADP-heptose:LPS heptosyltransferase
VGVSWRTANPASSWQRNADLALWHRVLAQKGVRFVCLQYGDCAPTLKNIHETIGVEIYQDPEVDPITDLDGFAAQVAAMDLVISIDNSTVHLAGALGKPVWTLLPYAPDWRWMLGRQDSPWYPSMRLFRQAAPGNWESMFDEVAGELRELLTGAS